MLEKTWSQKLKGEKTGEQEVFAEWVGVEYTVALLTQKDNICRHAQTHTHLQRAMGENYSSTGLQDCVFTLAGKVDAVLFTSHYACAFNSNLWLLPGNSVTNEEAQELFFTRAPNTP